LASNVGVSDQRPEAVRAGIVAMVRVATKDGTVTALEL
jgi:hypothetical protein